MHKLENLIPPAIIFTFTALYFICNRDLTHEDMLLVKPLVFAVLTLSVYVGLKALAGRKEPGRQGLVRRSASRSQSHRFRTDHDRLSGRHPVCLRLVVGSLSGGGHDTAGGSPETVYRPHGHRFSALFVHTFFLPDGAAAADHGKVLRNKPCGNSLHKG